MRIPLQRPTSFALKVSVLLYKFVTLKGAANVVVKMTTAQTATSPADLLIVSDSFSLSCFGVLNLAK